MKYLFLLIVLMSSLSAFAQKYNRNLYPGEYSNTTDMYHIVNGLYGNLNDKNCPGTFFDLKVNKLELSLGSKITAIKVIAGAENGRSYLFIRPVFDEMKVGADRAKCFVSN